MTMPEMQEKNLMNKRCLIGGAFQFGIRDVQRTDAH